MPREVSDIKQFIEICRRKDASCMFFSPYGRSVYGIGFGAPLGAPTGN
jgi:hypothetical protein